METGDDCHRTHPCYALFFRFRILVVLSISSISQIYAEIRVSDYSAIKLFFALNLLNQLIVCSVQFLEELGLLVKEDRKSHVLWNGSVGSMAYCCADRVFSMSILFDAGDIHDNSCWNSCFTN